MMVMSLMVTTFGHSREDSSSRQAEQIKTQERAAQPQIATGLKPAGFMNCTAPYSALHAAMQDISTLRGI